MCLFLVRHRFFTLALLIYLVPSFAFWAYTFASMPRMYIGGLLDLMMYVGLILLIVGMSFAFPAICLYSRHDLLLIIVPYYAVAYGILYLYWKRSRQKKTCITIT
jgi:hypothetical protein